MPVLAPGSATDVVSFFSTGSPTVGTFQVGPHGGGRWLAYSRFALPIPPGATVTSAALSATATACDAAGSPLSVTISVEAALDAVAIADLTDYGTRTTYGLTATWPVTQATSGVQTAPDVSTLVQNLVDQSGWHSGNHINLLFYVPFGGTALQTWKGFADLQPTFDVEFYVTQSSTATGARARRGATSASVTQMVTALSQRVRAGRCYPILVNEDGLVTGAFRRWTFVDPVSLATYTFDVNPNAATPASAKRPVDGTPTTAGDGVPITFQGESDVPVGEFSGSLLTKEQHEAFVAWWMKRREILLIDDLGNEHYVVLAKYSPERVQQTAHQKFRQKYTMQYLLMSEPS